jgi:tetratricopeptide (TPR) repeat protein
LTAFHLALIDGHRGRYYFHTKDYSQAEDLFQRAIAALEAKSSASTRDLALSELYCNLADLLLVTKDDGKAADALTRKSVELADQYFDRDALVYRYIDAVIVRAQMSTKNYFIAEGLFR